MEEIHHPKRNLKSFINKIKNSEDITTRNNRNMISYNKIREILSNLAKKADVKKRVNPHSFRYARATNLAQFLTEAQMKEFFGWTQASDMAALYVHLSGRDVDNAILKANGKLPKEEEERGKELRLKICSRCSFENSPESDFCSRCGLPLDLKTALEAKEKEKEFMKLVTPDIIEQLIEKKVQEVLKNKSI